MSARMPAFGSRACVWSAAGVLTLVCSLGASVVAGGQPARGVAPVTVFTGGRVIVGDGRVVEDATLLIRGDQILDVGPTGSVETPARATRVDLTGKTVLPALVNTHAHLGWEAYGSWGAAQFTRENLVDHLHRHAYYGVGTVISTGSDREDIALEVRQAQRLGEVGGASYLVSPGLGIPGGGPNPRFTNDPGWWGLHGVTGPAQAREVVRTLADRGIDILKIWVDARDERRGAGVKLHPDIYGAILDEAQAQDVRVIAHATTLDDHKRLLEAGARRFIHMPYDRVVDQAYLDLVEARNAFVVPTLGMVTRREPYRRSVLDDPFFQDQVPTGVLAALRDAAAEAARARPPRDAEAEARARVIATNFRQLRDRIVLGTDAGAVGDYFGYADHLELELFVRLGMTPSEAIAAATSRAARAFGLSDRGRIDAGLRADFVVLDANPLDDIMNTRQISSVYLGGERVDRTALRAGWTGARPVADYQSAIEGPQTTAGADGLGALSLGELMVEFGVPGVSVAVIDDFRIHWAKGYGVADVETGAPVDTETLFQAASISKPVTAMAILEAVEDGLFTLDDDINDILVSWTLDGGELTRDRPVTPRALTSHTSGLGDGFGFPGYDPSDELPTVIEILEGGARSNVGPVFMERPPLTFEEYSGGGVTVMQLALSDARGRPFDAVLQEDVLDPVGMVHSTFEQPLSPARARHAARAHDGEGRSRGPKWHVYPELAAAGLWTTPSDLARFAIEVQEAARGTSHRVLSRPTVREMLSPVGVGSYGVGFAISRRGQGWYFGHGGGNWGFRCTLLAHTLKGYGLVIMTNADRGGALIAELSRRIQTAYEWDSMAEPVRRGYTRPSQSFSAPG